jgi:hypothetical protein
MALKSAELAKNLELTSTIFMLTSWIPAKKHEEYIRLKEKFVKLPATSFIKEWQTLTTADGKNGLKIYNIIYVDPAHISEAYNFITRMQLAFAVLIEGYTWIIEPVSSYNDFSKIYSITL